MTMARPRKPEDPQRWEVPCDRCGEHRECVVTWHGRGVCGYCYQAAKRTRGVCPCGHDGVLPGIINGQPACRKCTGIKLNVDCVECGAEEELYAQGRCWRCVLGATVDRLLTNPETGVVTDELKPFATALKSMKRANSGLTWINQEHVTVFLTELARTPLVSHDVIDQLPRSRTRDPSKRRSHRTAMPGRRWSAQATTGCVRGVRSSPRLSCFKVSPSATNPTCA